MKKELVNHPDHYRDESGKECIDYMLEKWGPVYVVAFCILNAYKYNFRKGRKDFNPEHQDARKASWYYSYAVHTAHKLDFIRRHIANRIIRKLDPCVEI